MRKVVVIGNGGHSKVIQDLITSYSDLTISAILDDRFQETVEVKGIIKGPLSSISSFIDNKGCYFIIAIGDNKLRKRIEAKLRLPKDRYLSLVDKTANLSPSARIGNGTVIMAKAVVNTDTSVGDHAIINTGAIVEHDNRIESFVHVAPGVTLTGNVEVGEGSLIGAGSVIVPGITVGKWCVAGAGSTVINDLSDYNTAVGTPARSVTKVQK
ncbi:acetyltransferase [Halobacillus litoralis]|uniref:acetyltransferase n=1 Tax=Halobacillus litoralis TaxID=45668 RepID=UPI001CFDA721|nr:acetyltransferase [Halobacillus litoralis]